MKNMKKIIASVAVGAACAMLMSVMAGEVAEVSDPVTPPATNVYTICVANWTNTFQSRGEASSIKVVGFDIYDAPGIYADISVSLIGPNQLKKEWVRVTPAASSNAFISLVTSNLNTYLTYTQVLQFAVASTNSAPVGAGTNGYYTFKGRVHYLRMTD